MPSKYRKFRANYKVRRFWKTDFQRLESNSILLHSLIVLPGKFSSGKFLLGVKMKNFRKHERNNIEMTVVLICGETLGAGEGRGESISCSTKIS